MSEGLSDRIHAYRKSIQEGGPNLWVHRAKLEVGINLNKLWGSRYIIQKLLLTNGTIQLVQGVVHKYLSMQESSYLLEQKRNTLEMGAEKIHATLQDVIIRPRIGLQSEKIILTKPTKSQSNSKYKGSAENFARKDNVRDGWSFFGANWQRVSTLFLNSLIKKSNTSQKTPVPIQTRKYRVTSPLL
ncbi:hypothetical protein FGO68_gene7286 [Halteria grandinella]|uniref:Uncharacterized protein n=1 Tax=Halteria grandinella TaxID=5974 RepID=A0A8J8NX14_HALGN|nr:hypothetical protein FGO68_gene7286 [Halteria grandinella]